MKRSYIIAIILVAAAIGAIMSMVSDASTYASFNVAKSDSSSEFHVVGKLNKEKEMRYDPAVNTSLFSFYMTDNEGNESKVIYHGTKPNDFDRSEQIVIVGKMADQGFEASQILMKCPSKYNNTAETAKEIGQK